MGFLDEIRSIHNTAVENGIIEEWEVDEQMRRWRYPFLIGGRLATDSEMQRWFINERRAWARGEEYDEPFPEVDDEDISLFWALVQAIGLPVGLIALVIVAAKYAVDAGFIK